MTEYDIIRLRPSPFSVGEFVIVKINSRDMNALGQIVRAVFGSTSREWWYEIWLFDFKDTINSYAVHLKSCDINENGEICTRAL